MPWTSAAHEASDAPSHRRVVCFCAGCGAQLERSYNRAEYAKCGPCKRKLKNATDRAREWKLRRDVLQDPKRGTVPAQMRPGLVVVLDPGPHPLLPGLPLSAEERKTMLELGCFNPGTIIRDARRGRRYVVAGAAGTEQKLEAV